MCKMVIDAGSPLALSEKGYDHHLIDQLGSFDPEKLATQNLFPLRKPKICIGYKEKRKRGEHLISMVIKKKESNSHGLRVPVPSSCI